MARSVSRHLASPLGVLGVLLLSTACLPVPGVPTPATSAAPAERSTRNSLSVRIGKAVRGDITGTQVFAGELRAKGEVAVLPRVTARVQRIYVDIGSRVREGEPLADLDRSELEVQVLQAQAAQAAAESRLAQLKAGPRPEAVAQAQANLKAAQARQQALEAPRQGADPAALQKRLDDARVRLSQAEAAARPASNPAIAQADAAVSGARQRLNQLLADPTRANDRVAIEAARDALRRAEDSASAARSSGSAAQGAVERAQREVQDAEQALLLTRLSFNVFDLDLARALVEAADAQVKLVGAPASPDEVRAAEAAVEQAFALADLARLRLREATVTAPIAGVVAQLQAAPGATVGPSAPLMVLIPPELQVVLDADEGQAAQLQVGQSATVSVESYPQESFSGVVKGIAPVLDPRTRTVAVKLEVADPRGKLRPGMFVQLGIQTSERKAAVLVPKDAVVRLPRTEGVAGPPQSSVFVVIDHRLKRQRVVPGAVDARNVEILDGLTEGIDVVLNPRPDFLDGEQIVGE